VREMAQWPSRGFEAGGGGAVGPNGHALEVLGHGRRCGCWQTGHRPGGRVKRGGQRTDPCRSRPQFSPAQHERNHACKPDAVLWCGYCNLHPPTLVTGIACCDSRLGGGPGGPAGHALRRLVAGGWWASTAQDCTVALPAKPRTQAPTRASAEEDAGGGARSMAGPRRTRRREWARWRATPREAAEGGRDWDVTGVQSILAGACAPGAGAARCSAVQRGVQCSLRRGALTLALRMRAARLAQAAVAGGR
jgi:hypothetical protein